MHVLSVDQDGEIESATPTPPESSSDPARPSPARWWWVGMAGCLVVAAVLRLWQAWTTNGYGNSYYTAAALSMSKNWTAFLAGSVDSGNFVTIDKPSVWLWPSALLIKAFGLNWATLFLPTAVAGIAAVLVLGLAMREGSSDGRTGRIAALLAALGLAISPINVAIERDNNPDGMLVLALLLAGWMLLRAVTRARLRPLLGAAALIGLAFDVKYLQAYLVLPAFGLVWLISGVGSIWRRLRWLAGAAGALLAATAVWPVAVSLIPSGQRPWIGGSTNGGVVDLVIGYDGIGRILGRHAAASSGNSRPPAPVDLPELVQRAFSGGFSARPGIGRLLGNVLASQISWWLPLAVLGAVAAAVSLPRRVRTDPSVAGLVLWSGWAVCCGVVFSFMAGTFHPYYTNVLAPALAALSASGLVAAWMSWRRGSTLGAALLAGQVLVGAAWAVWVLHRDSAPRPVWLVPLVIAAGVVGVLAVPVVAVLSRAGSTAVLGVTAALIAVAVLAAPLTWSALTTRTPLNGGDPLANPSGRGQAKGGGFTRSFVPADHKLLAYLESNRGGARWIVAITSAMQAAPLIINSGGDPVMAMGGFSGADPVPTLDGFKALVAGGQVRYVFVGAGRPGQQPRQANQGQQARRANPGQGQPAGPGGAGGFARGSTSSQVTQWAQQACKQVDPASYGGSAQHANADQQAGPGGNASQDLYDCAGAA